jgi:hypothetical protein
MNNSSQFDIPRRQTKARIQEYEIQQKKAKTQRKITQEKKY